MSDQQAQELTPEDRLVAFLEQHVERNPIAESVNLAWTPRELARAILREPYLAARLPERPDETVTEAMEDAALVVLARSGFTRRGVREAIRESLAARPTPSEDT